MDEELNKAWTMREKYIRERERLAKIEVLDKLYKYYNMEASVLRHLDIKRDDLLYDINKKIDELKAGQQCAR